MEQRKNVRQWVMPLVFFGSLAIVGLVTGGIVWCLLNSPEFFTCFGISFVLSIPAYLCWGTTRFLLSQDNKERVLGIFGIFGRYICALIAIALCYVFLRFTSKLYLYILVPPTVIFMTYIFVMVESLHKGKEEG